MSSPKLGGPAFPDPARGHSKGHPSDALGYGMTLWDYYAAAALSGVAGNPEWSAQIHRDNAEWAAGLADAMLEERAKRMDELESFSPNPHCETPGKCREAGFCYATGRSGDDAWRCVLIAPTAGG